MIVAGLSGCGGASAPAAVATPAPAPPRELGIHWFVGEPGGQFGWVDGTGSDARFFNPASIAVDFFGNLYVAEWGNPALRKVTAAGVVTTVARPADVSSRLFSVAFDVSGNLYQVDREFKLQKITPAGATTTLMLPPDQLYPGALGARASRVTADKNGNIFIAYQAWRTVDVDCSEGPRGYCPRIYKSTLHKVSPSGAWVTLATSDDVYRTTDGNGHQADFVVAGMMAVDGAGTLYVSDSDNHAIIKITASGVVTTLAGTPGIAGAADGVGAAASFRLPMDLAVDISGNVYVNDLGNNTIRKITPSGNVTTVAGTAGKTELVLGALPGSLTYVYGLVIDASGDLVLSVNHGLIKITLP
jgi:hypothetical protein